MHVCVQRRCVKLEHGRYVSPDDIMARALQMSLWPKRPVYLQWRQGAYLEIKDKAELSFACRLVSEFHLDTLDPSNLECVRETDRMERSAEAHMAEPDSELEDAPNEDEDITMEDLLAWGCRRMGE